MHVKSNDQFRKFLYGIALAGMILSFCFGMSGSHTARAQEAWTETPTETTALIETPTDTTEPTLTPTETTTPTPNDYYTVNTLMLPDGTVIEENIINGPPVPPPGFEIERQAVSQPEAAISAGTNSLTVPAFKWVFGCSAVSGAMIAGYYDRNGYPNIYTGPRNDGVMPSDNNSWPTWSVGTTTYPSLPLAASMKGVDGRTTPGSIDDYWIQYNSTASDPYITGPWTQHTWGDAIGDYMKTSQSAFGNDDGSTHFYTWNGSATRLTCDDMASGGVNERDGTYGRKLFYEARGYTVTDCYNQKTDNNGGGFTFALFKAEIDAGRPVMLNLAGHTVVGVGYDDTTNKVHIHDTWDYNDHTMTWGGSYTGMALQSVSIVNLQTSILSSRIYLPLVLRNFASTPPSDFNKSAPANGATSQPANPTLSWGASSHATSYEYCIDTSNNNACDTTWASTAASTSVGLSGLTVTTPYYWQVRANNASGTTNADGGTWWSFTTAASPPGGGIVNGGFESGSGVGWTEYSSNGFSIIMNSGFPGSVTPHGGAWAAWLGGGDNELSYIQQQVTISSSAPYLTYYQWIASEDVCGYDLGGVQINNSVVDAYDLCVNANTGGWVKHSVNLNAYAGQSVTLQILVVTDSSLNSNLFVDDVSFQASASSSGPSDGVITIMDPLATQGKIGIVAQGEEPQGIGEKRLLNPR